MSDVARGVAQRRTAAESGFASKLKSMWDTVNASVFESEEGDSLKRAQKASDGGGKPDDITVIFAAVA